MRRMAWTSAPCSTPSRSSTPLVVGHSMGGMVALQLAHDTPADELRRRVAGHGARVDHRPAPSPRCPGYGRRGAPGRPGLGPGPARSPTGGGAQALASQDLRWWLTRLGFGADAPPAQVRFVEGLHLATPPRTLADLLPSLALFDLSTWLGSPRPPRARRGRVPRPAHRRRATPGARRPRCPRPELVELPRCGHMPMLERRREFSRLIDEFAAKIA